MSNADCSARDFRAGRGAAFVWALSLAMGACASHSQTAPLVNGRSEIANPVGLAECGTGGETCLLLDGVSAVPTSARLEGGSAFGFSPATWILPALTNTAATSRVLVLFDVSGSMKGAGMATGRTAVGIFLRTLHESRTRVAIAPFESHEVEDRVRAAQFGTPLDAQRALDALPSPSGNTGLYSAVREGALALAAAGAAGEAHLVVVTDGVNDVRSGDEPGLLAGNSGLATAIAATNQESVQVWAVGVGSAPDRGELAALAGSDDRSQVVASDFLPLSRALQNIAQRIDRRNRLVVGTSAAPALALSAGPRPLRIVVRDEGITREIVGEWQPPLLAPPVVLERIRDPQLPTGLDSGGTIRWWQWALLLMPVGLVLIIAVPVTLAMEVAGVTTPDTGGERGRPGAVRPSVQEARPRSPDEVTASHGERIVRLPGRE